MDQGVNRRSGVVARNRPAAHIVTSRRRGERQVGDGRGDRGCEGAYQGRQSVEAGL